jgi:ribosome-binding factor A
MNRKRSHSRDLLSSAAELGSDDGLDPKQLHGKQSWSESRQLNRKAQQLCGQVADALRVILPALADEVLQNLMVLSVEPAPHTGRLLVTVAGPVPTDVTDRDALTERLAKAGGRIRSEVAGAIHRRKTPELVFVAIG